MLLPGRSQSPGEVRTLERSVISVRGQAWLPFYNTKYVKTPAAGRRCWIRGALTDGIEQSGTSSC